MQPGGTPQALRVIAIKQADVAKKQQTEAEQWNQGVHGLVKSVDAASGIIVVNVRAGAVTKEVTVNTTSSTVLKRYAPGSVRFDQAQPAPIRAIQPGDQLWARGTKNADGTAIAADGIVSGSFLNIAGTILSTDNSASTLDRKRSGDQEAGHRSASPPTRRCGVSTTELRRFWPRGSRAGRPEDRAEGREPRRRRQRQQVVARSAASARAAEAARDGWIWKPFLSARR